MKINITLDRPEEAAELLAYLTEHKPKTGEKMISGVKEWAGEAPQRPVEAPKEKPEEQNAEPEKPAETDVKTLRVKVRGVLFKLNKKTGVNKSRELIQALGYNRLDDVKPEDLPKLYEKAKEALDA